MSERGSFITEYIYCDRCLEAVKAVLLADRKSLCSRQLTSWEGDGKLFPIIAGKIGGMYQGEELHQMEHFAEKLAKTVCHQVRIAVLAESGHGIITIDPIAESIQEAK